MRTLDQIRAMWIAFPAAPETRRLWRLRVQFLVLTVLLLTVTLLPKSAWQAYPALALLVVPLGLAAVIAGTRYFVSKSAADGRYQEQRISVRAFAPESVTATDKEEGAQ